MEFQMMLLKEAIEGRLHVPELRKKPETEGLFNCFHCEELVKVFEVPNTHFGN